jgi:hypothetical protein
LTEKLETIFLTKSQDKIQFCQFLVLPKGHEVFAKAGHFESKAGRGTFAQKAGLSRSKVRRWTA